MKGQIYSLISIFFLLTLLVILNGITRNYPFFIDTGKYLALDIKVQLEKINNDTLRAKFLENLSRNCKEMGYICYYDQGYLIIKTQNTYYNLSIGT